MRAKLRAASRCSYSSSLPGKTRSDSAHRSTPFRDQRPGGHKHPTLIQGNAFARVSIPHCVCAADRESCQSRVSQSSGNFERNKDVITRQEILTELGRSAEPWDVLVIGGGATGLGAAVEAASRGYRTLLVERFD